MAIKKAIKKKPTPQAKVVHKANKVEKVIKEEAPLEHSLMHNATGLLPNKMVGMNLGLTRNMENYESLRIDIWCTTEVLEGETHDEAITRIADVIKERLDTEVEAIIGE